MSRIKNYIKKVIIRLIPAGVKNELAKFPADSKLSYSQEGEDLILERIFENKNSGFYIDIGAHHPTRFSNTYLFYLKGWRGLNIDATPGSMLPFNKIRPEDINIEAGVTKEESEMDYYLFNEPALNTFSKSRAEFIINHTSYKLLKKEKLKTKPLAKILQEVLPPNKKIDFLTIDVEGLDLEILATNDWKNNRPFIVLAEDLNGSLENINASELFRLMNSLEYSLIARTHNTTFFKDKN